MSIALEAHDITKTYDCKTPGCENESRSSRGRHSYCPECQEARARAKGSAPAPVPAAAGTRPSAETPRSFEEAAKALVQTGRIVDRRRAKAAVKTTDALKAKRDADEALAEFRRQVRLLLGEQA